ncbi:MAG: SCO family protein [Bacteroidota bacterium]
MGLIVGINGLTGCVELPANRLPFYHTPDFTPVWKVQDDTIHAIAPFSFTDQSGNTTGSEWVKGKVHVANFFFTSCAGICPKMTSNLKLVADTFAKNNTVKILSFSVTPQRDSVPELMRYAKGNHIDARQWRLLTGNKNDIYRIARQSYFAEEEPGFSKDSSEFLHTEHVILVDQKGHIRGVYNGTVVLEMVKLTEDIKVLLKQ